MSAYHRLCRVAVVTSPAVAERPVMPAPDMHFQPGFWQPPIAPEGGGGAAAPYLVDETRHNSSVGVTENGGHPAQLALGELAEDCANALWLKGACVEHGVRGWRRVTCKRRDCDSCGPLGRKRIAERIAGGVRKVMADDKRCAILVLTFAEDVDKPTAVRRLGSFVKYLRTKMPDLQYAATYELQKSGRLHINLVAGPWTYYRHKELAKRWGARVSVEYVQDADLVAGEVAKTPEALGRYLAKLDQAVSEGRRVSFSKGWPRLPVEGFKRKGEIAWLPVTHDDAEDLQMFFHMNDRGLVVEGLPGEYHYPGQLEAHPECHCYEPVVELLYRRRRGYRERHGQVDVDVGMSPAMFEDSKAEVA